MREFPVSDCTFSPSLCHIDLGAIRRNFGRMGQAHALMPVIKSDAYGHGLVPVARVLSDAGARRFAVGTVSEAMALRDAGLRQAIVPLLGALTDVDWQGAVMQGLTPVVGNFDQLERAAAHCHAGRTLRVAIKCETGMGRLGFSQEELPQVIDRLRSIQGIEPAMVISHFSCADMPEQEAYTQEQVRRFTAMSDALREVFPEIERSLCNTAGTIGRPEAHFEVCRPGISLYGGNPFTGTTWEDKGAKLGLEWAMSVSAPVIEVRQVAEGQSVSYGRLFTAQKPSVVAVVAIGYATAFNRALSTRTAMLINGRRVPQVGRVCMGMIMADVTNIPQVRVGDTAWLVGGPADPGQSPVTPQDMADALGTISYEVLCLFGGMNPRVYG